MRKRRYANDADNAEQRPTSPSHPPNRNFATALHEAAHAVLSVYFERKISCVAITSLDGSSTVDVVDAVTGIKVMGIGGVCGTDMGLEPIASAVEDGSWERRCACSWRNSRHLEQNILIVLAGPASNQLCMRNVSSGTDADFALSLGMLKLIQPEARFENLNPYLLEAAGLLSNPRNWGAVLDLADKLVEKGVLTGRQVKRIINDSTRSETPAVSVFQ